MGTLVLRTQPVVASSGDEDRSRDSLDLKTEGATLSSDIRSLYGAVSGDNAGAEPANGTLVLLTPPTYDF